MRESIGSVDTGQMPDDEQWIVFALSLAKSYLEFVCGDAPFGTALEVVWHEHELGAYPTLAVTSEWGSDEAERYAELAEAALDKFNQSVRWTDLKSYYDHAAERELDVETDEDEDEG